MPVTHFDVALRRPLADGRAFGEVGPYEELKGRLRFALDPAHDANRRITDIGLAARNRDGRVELAADVSILLPVDRARANGRVIVDVVNRGNTVTMPNFNHATRPVIGPDTDANPPIDAGDGFLMRRGLHGRLVRLAVRRPRAAGPVPPLRARGAGRAAVRSAGRIYVNLQAPEPVPHFLLSDRGHLAYPAADVDEADAVLLVRDQLDGPAETIPRARWRFARQAGDRIVVDPRHVWLEGGFERGRLYQVGYTAVGAPVIGVSFAALRDCASWLKHGTAAEANPAAGALRWAYAYGRSQTGRMLRTLVHWDLNLDEQGREAFDGIIANVAGGMRGEFNQRFGQNSKDRPQMMAHVFPSADVATTDRVTGQTAALHARIDARGSRLKVFYTNTSAEYHRGDASLVHTDPDGLRDVAHGPHTRVFHFTGNRARPGPLASHRLDAHRRRSLGLDRALPEPPEHRQLRASAARLPGEPRPLGHRGGGAAGQPSPARGRRHRDAARRAGQGLRPDSRRQLSSPSRAPASARFRRRSRAAGDVRDSTARGPGVRLAGLRR